MKKAAALVILISARVSYGTVRDAVRVLAGFNPRIHTKCFLTLLTQMRGTVRDRGASLSIAEIETMTDTIKSITQTVRLSSNPVAQTPQAQP